MCRQCGAAGVVCAIKYCVHPVNLRLEQCSNQNKGLYVDEALDRIRSGPILVVHAVVERLTLGAWLGSPMSSPSSDMKRFNIATTHKCFLLGGAALHH